MHMSSDAGKREVYHRGRRHNQSTLSDMVPQAVRSDMSTACCGASDQIPNCNICTCVSAMMLCTDELPGGRQTCLQSLLTLSQVLLQIPLSAPILPMRMRMQMCQFYDVCSNDNVQGGSAMRHV